MCRLIAVHAFAEKLHAAGHVRSFIVGLSHFGVRRNNSRATREYQEDNDKPGCMLDQTKQHCRSIPPSYILVAAARARSSGSTAFTQRDFALNG
jgi:hypothetical protein